MSKRIAVWMTVLSCLAAWTVWAVDASPATLNALHDLTTSSQNGAVVVEVTGNYPIMDYTYYDYDPETFVVDMADVDVSNLPKTLAVNKDGVKSVKVESISHAKGRALAKLEIHKAYLAKCIVSTDGNKLLVKVVGAGNAPPPASASASPQTAGRKAGATSKAERASVKTVETLRTSFSCRRQRTHRPGGQAVKRSGGSGRVHRGHQGRWRAEVQVLHHEKPRAHRG